MSFEFEPLSGRILEAAISVHRTLGPGYLERVYERAMRVALVRRSIRFDNQMSVEIFYEGESVGVHFVDLVVEGQIIVELKAVRGIEPIHLAQLGSYLKATGLRVGLLLNFNSPTLSIKRVVS